MSSTENQIVVYQPNEPVRLEVRLADDTVWLNQSRLGELFGVDRTVVNRHIHNVYKTGELEESATCAKIAQVQVEGGRTITRRIPFNNLDVIIAIGYRVNSFAATQFRRWATSVLKDYLLRGYAVNQRLNQLEDKMDRRLAKHDDDIAELKDKVDFFVQTKEPPLQEVFFQGQFWDAKSLLIKFIRRTPDLRRGEDGTRNHPRTSRLNPQDGDGEPRIREYENGCEGGFGMIDKRQSWGYDFRRDGLARAIARQRADFHAETQRCGEGVAV